VYGFACPVIIDYSVTRDSWDYPLASAGTRYEDSIEVECVTLVLSVTDESGEPIYEDDEDVPNDLRSIYMDMFEDCAEELVKERT